MIDGLEIVLHVFRQAVEHVRVPALGRNVEFALAACVQQLLVKPLRVVQQDFVSAREKKQARQARKIVNAIFIALIIFVVIIIIFAALASN